MSGLSASNVRLALDVLALVFALFGPWWLPLLCMILLSLRFPAWEVPVLGLFMDFLWMPSTTFFPYYTLAGIALLILSAPIRRQLLL